MLTSWQRAHLIIQLSEALPVLSAAARTMAWHKLVVAAEGLDPADRERVVESLTAQLPELEKSAPVVPDMKERLAALLEDQPQRSSIGAVASRSSVLANAIRSLSS